MLQYAAQSNVVLGRKKRKEQNIHYNSMFLGNGRTPKNPEETHIHKSIIGIIELY